MSENQHKASETGDDAPAQPARRWLIDILFACTVLAIAIGLVVYIASRPLDDLDYDAKNFYTFGVGLFTAMIVGGWFLLRAPLRWYWKLLIPVLVVGQVVGLLSLIRFENFHGDMAFDVSFRFAPEADQLLAAPISANKNESSVPLVADLRTTSATDYPRFLGSSGRATIEGMDLDADWKNNPPSEVWRQPIGAGWSAFSVVGHFAVTQEQRGGDELVVCYDLKSGSAVWSHADAVRFSELMGGVGPRATPTIHEGKVYAQGATGILNCLDGSTGKVIWSRDIVKENDAPQILWGRSGSPLIVDHMVVVSAGGPDGKSLVAYHKETGAPIWSAGDDRAAYASPVLATLAGVRQILMVNEDWLVAHRVEDGMELWRFKWPGNSDSMANTSQPVALPGDRVFISKGYGHGSALLQVSKDDSGKLSVKPIWENAARMRTKMANVILHDGHVYGLSGGILECIELETGKRKWKRGRYGHGQIMLIGDVILVVSEKGKLVLVAASPKKHRELASHDALSDKTWNNPALAGRYLLVRNHVEAVCFRLPVRPRIVADRSAIMAF